jgi:hypothetical protein
MPECWMFNAHKSADWVDKYGADKLDDATRENLVNSINRDIDTFAKVRPNLETLPEYRDSIKRELARYRKTLGLLKKRHNKVA